MADHISIGLMGLGVIGAGVATAVREQAHTLAQRIGAPVRIDRALVRDVRSRRSAVAEGLSLTADADDILKNPNIPLVIEVMGGEYPAYDHISAAIAAGKHVVTANKEVMAKHGPELLRAAADKGVMLRFEASVGGGIPIIGPLLDDLAANDISAVNAIINGTTNYMLTRMATDGLDYATVLREAQELGYAEPDPAADVDGVDAAFKLAILASLAFRTVVRDTDVFREGISRLAPEDFWYAEELGYVIKLLATARQTDGRVLARVHPAFLPISHPLAKVDGVYNAVELEGDLVDWAMFQGPGAGARPTASAILADVVAIGRAIVGGVRPAQPPLFDEALTIETVDNLETKYYIRLRASDRPGVMAQVTQVLGDLDVSLASVIQKEVDESGKAAEIVITTHVAREADVQQALKQLSTLDSVDEVSNLIRVEERIA
ncbi:MAG: homoserine dehydrogenase [Chloroflexi bacterium]|nr:homoserine dehydrogenase [Chloroflexota bacterium]